MSDRQVLAKGTVERVGNNSFLPKILRSTGETDYYHSGDPDREHGHETSFLDCLTWSPIDARPIRSMDTEITAIGHQVVHGGATF